MTLPKDLTKREEYLKKLSESHKGQIVWNKNMKGVYSLPKGRTHTEESKLRMSLSHKGKQPWNIGKKYPTARNNPQVFKKGMTPWNKGKHWSEEIKKKMSKSQMGKKLSKETIAKMRGRIPWNKGKRVPAPWMIGRKPSVATIEKIKTARAKQIYPMRDSTIERKLHEILDSINMKYRKHFPVYHPKMGYHQVDIMFVDHEGNPKIAVECDGCFWHGCKEHGKDNEIAKKVRKRDELIDRCLQELGIKVIRIWEHDINIGKIPLSIY